MSSRNRFDKVMTMAVCHKKCRGEYYPCPEKKVQRFPVPDELVPWTKRFRDYKPVEFTSIRVLQGASWADEDIKSLKPKWHAFDGHVNRVSHCGAYVIDPDTNRPLNPNGRTGVTGRGLLGRWGPNHAADPIVTRWKRHESKATMLNPCRRVLEFVAILREDCKKWALPGGMVDPGETVSVTLRREFIEEALNTSSESQKEKIRKFFARGGIEIYRGYVDDPRNTDNAWMETIATNFHDDKGVFDDVELKAGDDAVGVKWQDVLRNLNLYASHAEFLELTAKQWHAQW